LKETTIRSVLNVPQVEVVKQWLIGFGEVFCYKKTKEKGQGSEDDIVRLKRVKEESVRDFGILLMIDGKQNT